MVKVNKKKFVEAVKGTGGIITNIAKRLNCSRLTLYKWLKKPNNKYAYAIIKDEEERMIDLAENSLYEQVKNNEQWATKYLLATKGKSRGYVEKQEVEHSGLDNINISFGEPVNPEKFIEQEKPNKVIEHKEE